MELERRSKRRGKDASRLLSCAFTLNSMFDLNSLFTAHCHTKTDGCVVGMSAFVIKVCSSATLLTTVMYPSRRTDNGQSLACNPHVT